MLTPMIVSSDLFSYSDNKFVAFISDLFPIDFSLGKIYPDACDVGFTISSTKTGTEVVFVKTETVTDSEGDTTHWNFSAVSDDFKHLKAVIFND